MGEQQDARALCLTAASHLGDWRMNRAGGDVARPGLRGQFQIGERLRVPKPQHRFNQSSGCGAGYAGVMKGARTAHCTVCPEVQSALCWN